MSEEEKSNLYVYIFSDLDDDFVFVESKYTLGDLHKLQQENKLLKNKLKEAINYINTTDCCTWDNTSQEDLLEILDNKGE